VEVVQEEEEEVEETAYQGIPLSDLRLIDFLYQSTLGFRIIQKREVSPARTCASNTHEQSSRRILSGQRWQWRHKVVKFQSGQMRRRRRSQRLKVSHANPRPRNPNPETRNPNHETRNPNSETRNPKPESRNHGPDALEVFRACP